LTFANDTTTHRRRRSIRNTAQGALAALVVGALLAVPALSASADEIVPTPQPTDTAVPTPTPTETIVPSPPTETPAEPQTESPTPTPTPTATSTPSPTPKPTPSVTAKPTPTPTAPAARTALAASGATGPYGPDGTHWPLLTPRIDAARVVKVAASWTAISAAIAANAATTDPVVICVAPGTIPGGNGAGSSAAGVLQNIGNAARASRILVAPCSGIGTVKVASGPGVAFVGVKGVSIMGIDFSAQGVMIRNSESFAIGYTTVPVLLVTANGGSGVRDVEVIEVVAGAAAGNGIANDRVEVKSAGGYNVNGLRFAGFYAAPHYKPNGSSSHTDTLQFVTTTGAGTISNVTIEDSVLFQSSDQGIMAGNNRGGAIIHSAFFGGAAGQLRYPMYAGGDPIRLSNLLHGTWSNVSVASAVVAGSIYPTYTFSRVSNSLSTAGKSGFSPLGSVTLADIDRLAPMPTANRLAAVWSASFGKASGSVTAVKAAAARLNHDYSGDGRADVLVRTTSGVLYRYLGTGQSGVRPRQQVGSGWSTNLTLNANDFDGDGLADVLARTTAGALMLYRGNGAGGWKTPTVVSTGWNIMNVIFSPGDFNGDGKSDVIARDTTGGLWLYAGNGAGGLSTKSRLGTTWKGFTSIFSPGDFSGDGLSDVIARDAAGNLLLYSGNGAGGWTSSGKKIGIGWGSFTAIVAGGDLNGDNTGDVLARDKAGALWIYPANGAGGWLAKKKVSTGWNGLLFVD
jgi:outer membrane biosynthesis protein TonB